MRNKNEPIPACQPYRLRRLLARAPGQAILKTACLMLTWASCAGAHAQPSAPAPAEFKLVTAFYEAGEKPLETAELLAFEGRVYRISAESREIVIVDPAGERVHLLDLSPKRKAQTSVSFIELDNQLARLRTTLKSTVERLEKKGGRANVIAAKMTRNLIDPKLTTSFDSASLRLHMKNDNLELDATGEPDADAQRLALVSLTLSALFKLESMRDQNGMPPFAQLDALFALTAERKLRPTELSVLYRLAGKPNRNRWTYRLVPSLTDREREALRRVDRFHAEAPSLRFDLYERHEKPE